MFHCPEPLEGNLWLYINLVSKVAAVLDKGCCFRSVLNINVVECWTFLAMLLKLEMRVVMEIALLDIKIASGEKNLCLADDNFPKLCLKSF